MRVRSPLLLLTLGALAHLSGARAASEAAGVVASVRGAVSILSAGSSTARSAELGMRLGPGDAVRVGEGSTAAVYLSGRGIVHVSPGQQLVLPPTTGDPHQGTRATTPLASGSMRVSEAGLWVLSDPAGSILVAAMRGGDEEKTGSEPGAVLSPRRETVGGPPVFYATGGPRPARIAIAAGSDVIWRGGSFDGSGPWTIAELPDLRPGGLYQWRVESPQDGSPLSVWIPFRMASAEDDERIRAFEREVAKVESQEGATAADVLRCGYYLKLQSWTPLLAAAGRLLAASPEARFGELARDKAIEGLQLDADRALLLAKMLAGSGS